MKLRPLSTFLPYRQIGGGLRRGGCCSSSVPVPDVRNTASPPVSVPLADSH